MMILLIIGRPSPYLGVQIGALQGHQAATERMMNAVQAGDRPAIARNAAEMERLNMVELAARKAIKSVSNLIKEMLS